MSKVYSFRLNDDNPREAQAREVIEAWVAEGYSLRFVIVEGLLTYKKEVDQLVQPDFILDQLKDLVLSLSKDENFHTTTNELSKPFLSSVKTTARLGLTIEDSSIPQKLPNMNEKG